ncbi:MAG: ribosome small subunit-dependent GTPase A [Cyanobium sp. M30B3]|jgi:ribosome biogenesis GTPase / thiamine phosphate phosphatase|nr:MAG: ribosome small subunit-dependent GTPase A [Cyanobium sp. M30B3]
MPADSHQRFGLVVALQANYCWVELAPAADQADQPQRLLCTRRTRLAKSGQTICVGDRVRLEGIDWPSGRAAIAAVAARSSLVRRPAVANVSLVVVAVAVAEPALDPIQLTRFLITAEATGQPVLLVFSKADLLPEAAVSRWCARAAAWGYGALPVSCRNGRGLEALRERLSQPGLAVVCGPSGVGKSSLLNGLRPGLELQVGAVSGRLQRGRHTTRHVELFALAPGALVADTPGFNRPELPADPAQLAGLFPEVRQRLARASCQFRDCLHQGEPGCAVGSDWERHPWYSLCLQDLCAQQDRVQRQQRGAEPGIRQRGDRLEPRLSRQLRQPSRRRQRQLLRGEDSRVEEGGGEDGAPGFSPPDPAG